MVSRKYPWNCEVLSLTSSDCTPVPPLDRSPPIANGLVHRHLVWLIVNEWLGRSPIAIVCVTSGFPHVRAPERQPEREETCTHLILLVVVALTSHRTRRIPRAGTRSPCIPDRGGCRSWRYSIHARSTP